MIIKGTAQDYKDIEAMGFNTNLLTDEQITMGCLGAENGESDWDAGIRVAGSIEQQAILYAESAMGLEESNVYEYVTKGE